MNDAKSVHPDEVLGHCPVMHWEGTTWRVHGRKYTATDPGGAQRVSGRFHRAPDHFPEHDCWPALYLALAPEISLGEVLRNMSPSSMPRLNTYRISEIEVELSTVVDCRNIAALGISLADLLNDHDYTLSQRLGAAALAMDVEGMLVPSATRLGDNLVVFPDQLRAASRLEVVGSRDPVLYVERS